MLEKRELPILRQALLRRGLWALRLGRCGKVETRVSTLTSWYYSGAETRLLSSASWLLRCGFRPSRLDAALMAVPLCVWSLDSTF